MKTERPDGRSFAKSRFESISPSFSDGFDRCSEVGAAIRGDFDFIEAQMIDEERASSQEIGVPPRHAGIHFGQTERLIKT
jgi:hypothetical protein